MSTNEIKPLPAAFRRYEQAMNGVVNQFRKTHPQMSPEAEAHLKNYILAVVSGQVSANIMHDVRQMAHLKLAIAEVDATAEDADERVEKQHRRIADAKGKRYTRLLGDRLLELSALMGPSTGIKQGDTQPTETAGRLLNLTQEVVSSSPIAALRNTRDILLGLVRDGVVDDSLRTQYANVFEVPEFNVTKPLSWRGRAVLSKPAGLPPH